MSPTSAENSTSLHPISLNITTSGDAAASTSSCLRSCVFFRRLQAHDRKNRRNNNKATPMKTRQTRKAKILEKLFTLEILLFATKPALFEVDKVNAFVPTSFIQLRSIDSLSRKNVILFVKQSTPHFPMVNQESFKNIDIPS